MGTGLIQAARRLVPAAAPLRRRAIRARQWLRASWGGFRNRGRFDDLEAYCLFVGPRRSGTTLLGQLLNAHPDAIIAHQLYALDYVDGWTRSQHIQRILDHDQEFVNRLRCRWNGYDYGIPGQWQGRVRTLKVIGDKGADRATRSLQRDPGLLERLERKVGVPAKFVMVVRNPFDVIGNYRKHGLFPSTEAAVDDFFARCSTCAELMRRTPPERWFHLRLESLVQDPARIIRDLCGFFGLDCPDDYLAACTQAVFANPKKTRRVVSWDAETIRRIEARSAAYDFLSGYTFDHSPV